MVTFPLADVVPTIACRSKVFVLSTTALAAITLRAKDTVAAVDVIETVPELEVTVAPEPEVVVIFPEPEMDTSPDACSAPVGATDVPPLIERFPEFAVNEPEPEYEPVGRIVID